MQVMTKLKSEWGTFLPGAEEFMNKEAQRAEELKLVDSRDEVKTFINDLMEKGTRSVMDITFLLSWFACWLGNITSPRSICWSQSSNVHPNGIEKTRIN